MTRGFFVLALSAFLMSGCSGGSGTITGKVTYQGRPLTTGQVVIWTSSGNTYASEIDADGNYRIEGCPPGKHKVSVASPDPAVTAMATTSRERGRGAPAANPSPAPKSGNSKWFAIPPRYSDPESSGLVIEVSGSKEHNISLD